MHMRSEGVICVSMSTMKSVMSFLPPFPEARSDEIVNFLCILDPSPEEVSKSAARFALYGIKGNGNRATVAVCGKQRSRFSLQLIREFTSQPFPVVLWGRRACCRQFLATIKLIERAKCCAAHAAHSASCGPPSDWVLFNPLIDCFEYHSLIFAWNLLIVLVNEGSSV